jgi:hypothetical protein
MMLYVFESDASHPRFPWNSRPLVRPVEMSSPRIYDPTLGGSALVPAGSRPPGITRVDHARELRSDSIEIALRIVTSQTLSLGSSSNPPSPGFRGRGPFHRRAEVPFTDEGTVEKGKREPLVCDPSPNGREAGQ